MNAVRIALLTIRLVMRTKVALFFTFFFPVIFLFVYAGLFAHGNPQAVAYMFGPVVTLNIMGSGFWGLGLQSVVQRERGSLRRYRLAPVGAGTMVTSNLLANYLLELPTVALLVFCAVVIFHMPMRIGVLTLLLLVTVGTYAFAGFGLTIASVANTMQEAQVYNNLVWLTLLFLSGTTVPLPLLPHWVQRVATFLPATYLVSSFQGVMMQFNPVVRYWPEMLALVASGTFGLLFAWKLFRWEKEERIPTRGKLWSLVFVIPFLLIGSWMNARANPTASWAMAYNLSAHGSASEENAKADNEIVVENFESSQASEALLNNWHIASDASRFGRSTAELSLVSPGAAGTQHALRLNGRLTVEANSPGSVSAVCDFERPPRDQPVRGIEFWVRGDPRLYQVRLRLPELATSLMPEIAFIPNEDWQSVKIPVAGVADASKTPALGPWQLEIRIGGFAGEYVLEMDEIRYY